MTSPPDDPSNRPDDTQPPPRDDPSPPQSTSSGWSPSSGQLASFGDRTGEEGAPDARSEQPGYAPPPIYGSNIPNEPPPWGQPGYGQPAYGQPPGAAPRTEQKAIIGLICSVIGVFCCGLLGIAGIVLGLLARRDIAASGGAKTGEGLALAAIIVGSVGLVLNFGFTIFSITSGGAGNPFVPGI